MRSRVVRVQGDGALEFFDRRVQEVCLAISKPEEDMELRRFAEIRQHALEGLSGVFELPSPEIGERQGAGDAVILRGLPRRFVQFEDRRLDAAHAEVELPQQVTCGGVKRLLRQQSFYRVEAFFKQTIARPSKALSESVLASMAAA